jgi:hypothetical protein
VKSIIVVLLVVASVTAGHFYVLVKTDEYAGNECIARWKDTQLNVSWHNGTCYVSDRPESEIKK